MNDRRDKLSSFLSYQDKQFMQLKNGVTLFKADLRVNMIDHLQKVFWMWLKQKANFFMTPQVQIVFPSNWTDRPCGVSKVVIEFNETLQR